MTRRLVKWIAAIVLVLLAIPVLAVVLVAVAANIDAGRRLIEQQTASLSGGTVRIQGLSGRFPDALRAEQIEVSDARGAAIAEGAVAAHQDRRPRGPFRRGKIFGDVVQSTGFKVDEEA